MAMIDNIGSTAFNLAYLGVLWGAILFSLAKHGVKTRAAKLVFGAFAALGTGDAFHLLTRTVVFFESLGYAGGQSAYYSLESTGRALGVGLVATSVTVTFFYLVIYFLWRGGGVSGQGEGDLTPRVRLRLFWCDVLAFGAVLARLSLIAYPQNGWGATQEVLNPFRMAANLPLYVLGVGTAAGLLLHSRDVKSSDPRASLVENRVGACFLASFAFYSPVILLSWINPYFGLFMIPKTLAYLVAFFYLRAQVTASPEENAS
ncbi:MAG: hypothetical protein Kow0069_37510 [Promethearchaeota archaeon]